MNDYVQLFSLIAGFILIMGLHQLYEPVYSTVVRETGRTEVGIRKSLGSQRRQLIQQFIGESMVISFISMLIAILATELVLPSYNLLVDKDLSVDYSAPVVWLTLMGIVVFTGIVSGSYPAF